VIRASCEISNNDFSNSWINGLLLWQHSFNFPIAFVCKCHLISRRFITYQDVHSGRRNGALYGRKRWFTALIFTLFHRNPSVRITTAVSGRFLLWNDHLFTPFLYTFLECTVNFFEILSCRKSILNNLKHFRTFIIHSSNFKYSENAWFSKL
jgi:hypothetical protein